MYCNKYLSISADYQSKILQTIQHKHMNKDRTKMPLNLQKYALSYP